jgi:tRNA (guanine-N(7)-)-methyltransferase subunit TRM82
MLTDIVYTKIDGRSYIITADRDEHIRVSRGPPQAHIIEGFCFGHEAFINKLCLTRSGLLVSGGGDAHLFVWDWREYRLSGKLAIKDAAWTFIQALPGLNSADADYANFRVAVSGIWNFPSRSDVSIAKCPTSVSLISDRLKRLSWPAKEYRHCSASP